MEISSQNFAFNATVELESKMQTSILECRKQIQFWDTLWSEQLDEQEFINVYLEKFHTLE